MAVSATISERVLFAPFDETAAEFLAFVGSATKSLAINIYGFHLPPLTDLLIAKHRAGVMVSLILDNSQDAGRAEGAEGAKLVGRGGPLLGGQRPVRVQYAHGNVSGVDGTAAWRGTCTLIVY